MSMPIELGEEGKKTPRRRLNELKPQKNHEEEAARQPPRPQKPKKAKTNLSAKPKKSSEQTLGGKKGKEEILSLTESPQYESSYELLKPLGPVFDQDKKKTYFVSRLWTGTPDLSPVIEMTGLGPYHESMSTFRPYGMVERLSQLALTLQFYYQGVPMALKDLRASHGTMAGQWLVTKADVDSNAGTVSIKIAKEKDTRFMNIGDEIDAGALKIKLVDVPSGSSNPAILDVLDANNKVLDQIRVNLGDTYLYTDASSKQSIKIHVWNVSPTGKWADVAILSEEHTLTHGQRYDLAQATDPNWKNWWVAAGTGGMKKDGRMEYTQGIDFSSNTLSIYCDDIQSINNGDIRFKKGDTVQMPLGYELRCDGMANDWKNKITISAVDGPIQLGKEVSPGNWDGNTRGELAQGPFIKVINNQADFFYNPMSLGGGGGRMAQLFVDPQNDKAYAMLQGNSYYIPLDGAIVLGDIGSSADPINRLSYGPSGIGIQEMGRKNGTPNILDGTIWSNIDYELKNNQFRFKPSDTATSLVEYQGLNETHGTKYELPFTTEHGSQWTSINQHDATFEFNVGGNEPGITDGMARFKWSVLDHNATLMFENPEETTDGRTKNGIDERWRYPERYVIPSKFNSLYQDGIEEVWALSQEGTEFNFVEQRFRNQLDYFAIKIRPKDQWVEGVSKVPIMGTEYTLTRKDDGIMSPDWDLTDVNTGAIYMISLSRIYKVVNKTIVQIDPSDPFYGFTPYLGDCAKVEDITNPDMRSGNDVLWLKKNVDTFIADAGPQAISSTASMRLDQQPRTQKIGFEIGGPGGTRDAVKISLQGWEGANSTLVVSALGTVGTATRSIPLNDVDELYYRPVDEQYGTASLTYKSKATGQYETVQVRNEQVVRIYKSDAQDFYNSTSQAILSKTTYDDHMDLTLTEPIDRFSEASLAGNQTLASETDMSVYYTKASGKVVYTVFSNQATYSLSSYRKGSNAMTPDRTVLQTYTQNLTDTKYDAKGTQIEIGSEATHVAFARFDNDTYPTRFNLLENFIFRAPLETTDGKTKNGIPNYLFPNLSIIPSEFNGQYADGIEQLHLYSADGTTFGPHYDSSGKFENKPEPMALKVMAKNGWVEGESSVPIWGKEMLLMKKDDANRRWEVQDADGTTYALMDGKELAKVVNGQDVALDASDQLMGFKAWIGECERVDKLYEVRMGTDVLWLEIPERLRMRYTSGDAYTIAPGSKLGLEEPLRNRHMGLEIENNKDFGTSIGRRNAVKIDLTKWTNGTVEINDFSTGQQPITVDVNNYDELYYAPSAANAGVFDIIFKQRGQQTYGIYGPYSSDIYALQIKKGDSAESVLLSNRTEFDQTHLIITEPLSEFTHDALINGYVLASETDINLGPSDPYGSNKDFVLGDFRASTSIYSFDTGTNSIQGTALDERRTSTLQFTNVGTKIDYPSSTRLDFAFFDNFTDPTHWKWTETYSAYQKMVAQPITAPLEYTKGETKIGYYNYDGMPWLTYPIYCIMPSDYFDRFQPNVKKAEFHIFSPLGTQFDPNAGTISNTALGAAYYLGLEQEPRTSELAFLFSGTYKLLQQPATITDFVPLPSNMDSQPGTKMYGVLGSTMLKTKELLDSISGESVREKLGYYAFGAELKAWAVQDDKSVYLLVDGLPVLKMRDWAILDPDEAAKDDPLCKYIAVFGEGKDLRDVTNGKLDKGKAALWMLPLDLFGTTYAPGERMEFPGGPGFTLTEKPRDEMKVEIVEKQFADMSEKKPMYHVQFTPGEQRAGLSFNSVSSSTNQSELYLQPLATAEIGGQQYMNLGTIYDKDGNVLYNQRFSSNTPFWLTASEGWEYSQMMMQNSEPSLDHWIFTQGAGRFDVGGKPIILTTETAIGFDITKNADNEYTGLIGADNVTTSSGRERYGDFPISGFVSFDKQNRNSLDSPFFAENGTIFQPLGPSDARTGFSIQSHSNATYPVFWSMDEQLIPYQPGDPMAGWRPLSAVTSYLNTYPNPVSRHGKLTIDLQNGIPGIVPGSAGIVEIGAHDLLGRPVGHLRVESIFPSAGQTITIDMKKLDLAPGPYYLFLNAANQPMSESRMAKIIVTE